MRTLVRWCLDRPSVIILATSLVLIGGLVGASQLRQQLFPDIDFPFVITTLEAPGLDSVALDEQVAQPVGRAVEAVDDVEQVATVASEGTLRLYVQLAYGSDTAAAQDEIAKRIGDLTLPDGVSSPEFAGGFTEQPVMVATMSADDGDLASLTEDAERLQADLEGVDGVARVDVAGGSDPRLQVLLGTDALARGVRPQQVADAIRATQARANVGFVTGEGGIPTGVVATGPELEDAAVIERVLVPGANATIGELGTVRRVDAADAGFATANGKPAISISVYRATSGDEIATVDGAQEVLDDTDERLDQATVSVLFETASDIRGSIRGLLIEAGMGALGAVLVIFLFLRTVRGTLVAAISIPTSIVFGLLAAWLLGLTINIITLAGLTIAVGRVIDDGIVVLENIYKHLERGEPRRRAMIEGTSEVATPIAASTIATAAVFLPIGLVGGLISEIFLSFSIIVTVALLASLLVAVTVIPVVGAMVLRPSTEPHDPDAGRLARIVEPATRFGIHRWYVVLGAAFVAMLGTFALIAAGAIPTQFLPDSGTNQVFGSVQLPPGTSPDEAKQLLAPLDEEIDGIDGVDDVQVSYGIESAQAAFDPTIGPSTAEFFFTLDEDADAEEVETRLRAFGVEQYPGGFTVARLEEGPPSGSFGLNIEGESQDDIATAATQVAELLEERADEWDLVEVQAQAAREIPQLVVRTRPDAPVAPDAVQAALSGLGAPVEAGSTTAGAPITVGVSDRVATDPASLGRVAVPTITGGTVPLARVATITPVVTPAFVNRVDGTLSGSVDARMLGEDVAGTTGDIKDAIADLDLEGVEFDYSQGDQQFINEMFADIGLAMAVAIALVFLVLVVTFGSVAQPFTILAPIMFSFIGSFGALIVTGRALGLPAMIGQLLLIGIIVSNSILLVDSTIRLRRAGMRRDDALAAAARLRVRPVLMTAGATIAALTPLSLGISGEGGIISQSLGTVVIGGLLVATLLTLVIVPAVYRLFDRDRPMTDHDDDADPRRTPAPETTGVGAG